MEATMEQFDGEFIHITAGDIRDRDVILGGARTVTAAPAIAGGAVAVATITGPETYAADAPVYVFRPTPGRADEPCPDCDAAPGEPCDWTCLSYPALDDAAGTNLA
jgi:hypothetical protein